MVNKIYIIFSIILDINSIYLKINWFEIDILGKVEKSKIPNAVNFPIDIFFQS